ncbi:MAG: hypothetical protein RJQ07_08615 [Pseudomonadales bacterium]
MAENNPSAPSARFLWGRENRLLYRVLKLVDHGKTGHSGIRTRFHPAVCFALFVTCSTAVWADHVLIFRWVDPVDGDVHYSARAPTAQPYDVVSIEHPQPVDTDVVKRLEAINKQAEQSTAAHKRRREAARIAAAEAATRKQDCAQLRDLQLKLESRPGSRFLVMNSDGTARRMTEAEHQSQLEQARQRIVEACG